MENTSEIYWMLRSSYSMTCTSVFKKHFLEDFAAWMKVLSCWKMKLSLTILIANGNKWFSSILLQSVDFMHLERKARLWLPPCPKPLQANNEPPICCFLEKNCFSFFISYQFKTRPSDPYRLFFSSMTITQCY